MSSQQQQRSSIEVDTKVLNSDFLKEKADVPLRITCYGSSSRKTPEIYLKEAKALGYVLAKRGHTMVNGAGQAGCMQAMNDGGEQGNGHIIGVIHEMFTENGEGFWKNTTEVVLGKHSIFDDTPKSQNSDDEPIREIFVASGNNLQERKRLLVNGSDGLVVLPGGPGTWDELWEMACCRNIGLTDLPIVCVNVEDYYKPFHDMLKRASKEGLVYMPPEDIVHFENTAEAAVQWIETKIKQIREERPKDAANVKKKRTGLLKQSSFLDPSPSLLEKFRSTISRTFSSFYAPSDMSVGGSSSISDDGLDPIVYVWTNTHVAMTFVAGLAIGATVVVSHLNRKK